MTKPRLVPVATVPASRRYLPVLLLLFVGSGCAALIYEIVWFQLLQLVIGSSAISLGVLLGTFMGGMCLGSLLLPRFVAAREHPLRAYALLELGIAFFAVIVLVGVPRLGGISGALPGSGASGVVVRATICGVFLLAPTILMGATLPAIARWVESTPAGVSWLGFFYGSNIAGAVLGCLLAGFYLLRVHDMAVASYAAVAINVLVAVVALALAKRTPHLIADDAPARGDALTVPDAWTVYVAIALSGLTALGAEVVWTRLLSLMLGASVYTFSIILAVFLVGLGIGSGVGWWVARTLAHPRVALGWCQMMVAAAVAWSAFMISVALPHWPINPSLTASPWLTFQLDLTRTVWAVFPGALLWGASFPLALASVVSRGVDSGRVVGRVYAANTVGAIGGALLLSSLGVPLLGSQGAQRALIVLAVVSALLVLVPVLVRPRVDTSGRAPRRLSAAVAVAVAVVAALALVGRVPKVPDGLIAYGRFLPTYAVLPTFLYVGEGMNSSVAVSEEASGARNFHVSGKVEASTLPQDMRLQRMLGHMSALLHPEPRSVLVVGFGAGVTAGTFVLHPSVTRIVICEIEPLIPEVVSTYFRDQNYDVLRDPRVEVVYDDARHYILTTGETFDVITSDPIHPWVKGAATLYTKEYFELAKSRLNPGGVITQWVPLYESTPEVVKSEFATFFDAFPEGTIWGNEVNAQGYDVVLAGTPGRATIDVDALQRRLEDPASQRVAASLFEVGFQSLPSLLATYAGRGPDLKPWLADAEINRDRNLRLQYLAGMGLNLYQNERIYAEMLRFRKYPEALFKASPAWEAALRGVVKGGQ